MPKYTVEDSQTGKRVTFEWAAPNPPTDIDMEEVFSVARQEHPEKFTPVQELAKSAVGVEKPSFLKSLAKSTGRFVGGLFGGPIGQYAGEKIGENREAVVEAAPAVGMALGGAAAGPLAPVGAGVGGVIGEGVRMADRALMGKPAAGPVSAPFVGELPQIPFVGKPASNLIQQGAMGAATELPGAALSFLGPKKDLWAAKALGATKRFLNTEKKMKLAEEVGRTMAEQGVITKTSSPETMLAGVNDIEQKSGKFISDFLDNQSAKFDAKRITTALEELRPKNDSGKILSGGHWDVINSRIDNAIQTVKGHAVKGKKLVMGPDKALSMKDTETLGDISFKEANQIKSMFQDDTNWFGRTAKDVADKMIAGVARREIDSQLDNVALAGGELKADFIKNKKLYGHAQTAKDYLMNRISSDIGNKKIGLTDWIALTSGLASGNPIGALATYAGKNVAEKYGANLMATMGRGRKIATASQAGKGFSDILTRARERQKAKK